MSRIEAVLREVARHLDEAGRRWALVGGLAVSARTEPRFTRDVDLALTVADDRDAESVVAGLVARGYRPWAALEQVAASRLATVRLSPIHEQATGMVVDLLFASSGIEPEVVSTAEPLEVLPELRIPVASIEHLIALKVLARDDRRRPQDRMDLLALLRVASPEQVARARAALALITARGFHRDKDLAADFAALLNETDP